MKLNATDSALWCNTMIEVIPGKGGTAYVKDMGGASAMGVLMSRLGHDLIGHDESGRLVIFNGTVWKNDQPWLDAVYRCAMGDEWSSAKQNRNVAYIVGSTDEIPAVVGPWLNFQNLMIDRVTGETAEHSPDLCGTLQFGCSLAVGATDAERPRWHQFLAERVPADAHGLLQEFAGYLMHWGNPYRVAAMLHGPTGSGKSTFIDVMTAILGEDNISGASLQTLTGNRFAVADLFGKVANLCGDIDGDTIKRAGLFKQITSGDVVRAERKGENQFTFRPVSKLVFSANTLPKSVDKTEAWLDRWLFLPFPVGTTATERDQTFTSGLMEELPAIAWWAFEGLQRLMARGHFEESVSVASAKHEYRLGNDDVLRFLNEHYEIVARGSVKGSYLWDHYVSWWSANNMGRTVEMSSSDFYEHVRRLWKPREPTVSGNAVYFGLAELPVIVAGSAL